MCFICLEDFSAFSEMRLYCRLCCVCLCASVRTLHIYPSCLYPQRFPNVLLFSFPFFSSFVFSSQFLYQFPPFVSLVSIVIAIACDSFNDYISKSDYIASNGSESQPIRVVQESGRVKVQHISLHFPGRTRNMRNIPNKQSMFSSRPKRGTCLIKARSFTR